MIAEPPEEVSREILEEQIRETASVFAMDMLILKFIQGFPVVGILGGIANPIYYNRVLRYVQLKYRKRYLLKQTDSLGVKEMREESL
ncbi:MAG: EcsC family protein [Lachnospiraceae bacterium]|nr:EcsC family protein [Lachnospiraceae bacterium]